MESQDHCQDSHSELEKSMNENPVKNVAASNSLCDSNVMPSIISVEEKGLPTAINPPLEPLLENKMFSIKESCEPVKELPSASSTLLENREDCLELAMIPIKSDLKGDNEYCNKFEKLESEVKVKPFEIFCDATIQGTCITPYRDISKSHIFQQGVAFTSTPLSGQEIKKGMRNVFDNLSIIKEEEGSLLDEPKELSVEITKDPENIPQTTKDINLEKENKSDISILKKDELSLLIDIPAGRILTEEKVDVNKNHLTLSVQNSESVVYKNIIDKTVDDLLIEGKEFERIQDICNLEIESDGKQIRDKAVALKPFVSSNDDENRDNDDPEWELLRKLETDDDRYKAVRKIWRNLAIPDLKQNLSTFNWRKKNALPTLKNIVPIKVDQIGKRKKNLVYECTEVFDVGIKKLEEFCRRQYQGIRLESDNETSMMASLSKKPRLDNGPAHLAQRDYQTDFDKINECFQERLQRHLEAKEEIRAVHGFYNGLKNQGNGGYGNVMIISHEERQNILEIESMISHYNIWYNNP